MARSSRDSARQLFSLALGQGGYFTAKQAQEAGYGYPHLEYHVSSGNFDRVDHGLYRLTDIPPGEHDDLIRWSLWSRNQLDEPQAVASHETALTNAPGGGRYPCEPLLVGRPMPSCKR